MPYEIFRSSSQSIALRLAPHCDLKRSLIQIAAENGWHAAAVTTIVGSLLSANLRYANQKESVRIEGPLEIVAVSGTLGGSSAHLHIAVSDGHGRVYGGHLVDGCAVFTTAEIVLTVLNDVAFERELDPATGYLELKVRQTATG